MKSTRNDHRSDLALPESVKSKRDFLLGSDGAFFHLPSLLRGAKVTPGENLLVYDP